VRSVVVGLERSADADEWKLLRDWQLVRRLNELLGAGPSWRKAGTIPDNLALVVAQVAAARRAAEAEIPNLDLGFRVPVLELLAVLWPGTEGGPATALEGELDANDDLL
jgi:hypothetical protein